MKLCAPEGREKTISLPHRAYLRLQSNLEDFTMFFEENAKKLQEFSRVSKTAGARADYVQGGGGNTSVKLDGDRKSVV